ncbi:hypothetical protein SH449x_004488 [Pirellulaceae bacterium SH449]
MSTNQLLAHRIAADAFEQSSSLEAFQGIVREDSRVFEASCEPSSLIAFCERLRTDWLEKGIVKPTALTCPAITQAQFGLKTSPDVTTALAVLQMAASGEDGPFESMRTARSFEKQFTGKA